MVTKVRMIGLYSETPIDASDITDITLIVGRDIGLMIRAFAAALEDDNLLVRRSVLDLLLQSLRMDNAAVQKASAEDRAILMRAATSVVMRRDSSLNRRLYTWLLGPQENSEQQTQYFKSNALELLRATLQVSYDTLNRNHDANILDAPIGGNVLAFCGILRITAIQDFYLLVG